jgi:hypothetical protein
MTTIEAHYENILSLNMHTMKLQAHERQSDTVRGVTAYKVIFYGQTLRLQHTKESFETNRTTLKNPQVAIAKLVN